MVNMSINGPDYTTLNTQGKLNSYQSQLCHQLLIYCSRLYPGADQTSDEPNPNIGCIPLSSSPNSNVAVSAILTRLVLTAKTIYDLGFVQYTADTLVKNASIPLSIINSTASGSSFVSSFNVLSVTSNVVQSPPPPSPPPPSPPPPDLNLYAGATIGSASGILLLALLALLLLRILFYLRTKTKADAIGSNLNAPALAPPLMNNKKMDLKQLPNIISAQHFGMPADLAAMDMRLLRMESVMTWERGIMVFESVAPSDYIQIPYGQVTAEQWNKTMVLTWRW